MHGLTVARINFEYVKRLEPKPQNSSRKHQRARGISRWFANVTIDLKRLLAARGSRDPIIQQYLENPDLIWRGTSTTIGHEVELALAERIRLGITSLRPYDVPWRVCRRLTKLARNSRKKLKAREERRAAGMVPWSESLAQTKPWEKEGIGRSTWFDRRRKMELSDNGKPEEELSDAARQTIDARRSQVGDRNQGVCNGTSKSANEHRGSDPQFCGRIDEPPTAERNGFIQQGTSGNGGRDFEVVYLVCDAQKRRSDESVPPPNEELEQAAHSSPSKIEEEGNREDHAGNGRGRGQSDPTPDGRRKHQERRRVCRRGLGSTPGYGARKLPAPRLWRFECCSTARPEIAEEGQPMAPELPKTEPKPNHFRGETMEQLRPDDLKDAISEKKFFCGNPVPITERARGYWSTILPALGMDPKFLTAKNGPCPMCGGKDRFRFTDLDGKGTWWCNGCDDNDGRNGFGLAIKFTGLPYEELKKRIEEIIGGASLPQIRAARPAAPNRAALRSLWTNARPIEPDDPVDRYLTGRGITIRDYPPCLRFIRQAKHADGSVHPAMLAAVLDTEGKPATIHKTYLTFEGGKAAVDPVRLFCPGTRPAGGAVRLSYLATSSGELGIAEGIETALSASQLHGVPVWAALDSGGLERFIPPPEVTRLIIYGDHDANFAGHKAAYCLAMRAILVLKIKVEVRIPDRAGTDWNDVLRGVQP